MGTRLSSGSTRNCEGRVSGRGSVRVRVRVRVRVGVRVGVRLRELRAHGRRRVSVEVGALGVGLG